MPLLELTPIRDDDEHRETGIATALDHYKFFYRNLWYSFDATDDDSEDWISEHLEHRSGDMQGVREREERSDISIS